MTNLQISGHIDLPAPGESVYDQAIFLSGWVYLPKRDLGSCRVRAFLDDACVAETRILFCRPDVSKHLSIASSVPTGFRMLGKTFTPAKEACAATLRVTVSDEGDCDHTFAKQRLRLVPARLHERAHGDVVHPDNAMLLHRENIYGSGPPVENPSEEAANLVEAYLPRGASVVDVGCGAGAYGPRLIAAGHDWVGLEANRHCCEILERRQLPFRRVDLESRRLPGLNREWECAICIEVLEHIADPELFVQEIRRVIRRRALFSVPNLEVLPHLHGWGVVPWHLLEADHKNFFTRASLQRLLESSFARIEIFSYGEFPLRTGDGIPLYAHFFAVADA
jgi:2-polyprenyl-3-methyl-5-hydroxy-6-metoxy-1,4-benzoquinol methylase